MRKYLLVILVMFGLIAGAYVATRNRTCPVKIVSALQVQQGDTSISRGFELLRIRKDKEALGIFENILAQQPQNIDALWAKAEVLRRNYQFKQTEDLLSRILKNAPEHFVSLNSLAYIRYKEDKLNEALKIVTRVIKSGCPNRQDEAMACMLLGMINSRRASKGWILTKFQYGIQIKCYLERAKALSPELPEVHLALGTFFLKAPVLVGGNVDKAIKELEVAIKIAPDFATANARLAQAYKKKGNLEKYNFYIQKAKELDPENEALKELQ